MNPWNEGKDEFNSTAIHVFSDFCKTPLKERFLTGRGFALYPSSDFAPLAVDKAGLRSLANPLAAAFKKTNIRL